MCSLCKIRVSIFSWMNLYLYLQCVSIWGGDKIVELRDNRPTRSVGSAGKERIRPGLSRSLKSFHLFGAICACGHLTQTLFQIYSYSLSNCFGHWLGTSLYCLNLYSPIMCFLPVRHNLLVVSEKMLSTCSQKTTTNQAIGRTQVSTIHCGWRRRGRNLPCSSRCLGFAVGLQEAWV